MTDYSPKDPSQGADMGMGISSDATLRLAPAYDEGIQAPWTPIHVSKANEQRTSLSLALDRALAEGEWQLAATLAHAMSALARDINGFYGR